MNLIAVGNSVTVHAKKTNNEPAPSSWSASGSVSVGGGGSSATVTGTAPSNEEYDGVVTVTSINNDDASQSDSEAFTVVGVVSIEAEPEMVCLGNTNVSFKITTQPEGYNHMVSYTRPNLTTPGIKQVVATCGSSSATCEVTVVKVESIDVDSSDIHSCYLTEIDGRDNICCKGIRPCCVASIRKFTRRRTHERKFDRWIKDVLCHNGSGCFILCR